MSTYININIAGRNYRITASSSDEETLIQESCQQINKKLEELKNSYRAKDTQDYLAMTALTMAVEANKRMEDSNSLNAIEIELDESNKRLNTFIDSI